MKLEPTPTELPAEVEYNLLRIAQEAIANSVKHSAARNVEVTLQSTPSQVSLAVRDDGDGFGWMPGGRVSTGHYGLIGMQERATHIGAAFKIDSEPGRGTTVRVTLPVRKSAAGAPIPMVQPSSELGS